MCPYDNNSYKDYWAGVLSMDKEAIFSNLNVDSLKCLSNKELCKLFKFLSCFFCCLDECPCEKNK